MRPLSRQPRTDILRILADGPRTAAQVAQALGLRSARTPLQDLQENGILVRHRGRYAISDNVSIVSTSEQHIFTFTFPERSELTLGLNRYRH